MFDAHSHIAICMVIGKDIQRLISTHPAHQPTSDSGANKTRSSCNTEESPCSNDGKRHVHVLSILKAPQVVHAALGKVA